MRRKMMGLFMAVTLGIAQMAIPVLADETEEILLLEEADAEEEFALEEEEGVVGLGIDLEEVVEESEKTEIPEEEISEAEIVLGGTELSEAENVDDGSDVEEAVVPEISVVEATDDEVVMEIEIIEEEELPLFDATSESVSEGTCGENLTWTLDADKTLTITGSGPMADFDRSPWLGTFNNPKVEKVILDDNITTIGDLAFLMCGFETIDLPSQLESIGVSAFTQCRKLTRIVLPDGVKTVDDGAFSGCVSMTSISIPPSVISIGATTFRSCSKELTIYGKAGSYAQTYAEENNIPFVAVTALGEVTLPETSFVYTGSAIEPEPVVCDDDGNALVRDTNYTVTYADNTGIGTATVTVTGMDGCTGEVQLTFEIVMPFGDVPTDYEYYNEIADIFMRGLMTGMNETTFEPETTMNRAFMAAVLYRRAGYPAQPFQPIFPDVKEEDWFAECVLWAQASGNMYGYNEGTFGPTDQLNREQLCTILWRYAETTDGVDNSARANLEDYPDSKRVSDFAKDAISWCIATGIFEDHNGRLDAWQPATRAELAVMLSRYLAVAGK